MNLERPGRSKGSPGLRQTRPHPGRAAADVANPISEGWQVPFALSQEVLYKHKLICGH